jgi:hypothetical protein
MKTHAAEAGPFVVMVSKQQHDLVICGRCSDARPGSLTDRPERKPGG